MIMGSQSKPLVFNSFSLRNTVGAELVEILEARGIENYEELLGVKDLRSEEELSNCLLEKIGAIQRFNEEERAEIPKYLETFQEKYLEEKKRYKVIYKDDLANFRRLEKTLTLLKNEFDNGVDRLEDILEFFEKETPKEVFKSAENISHTLFNQRKNSKVDPINLYAWLRRGELDFRALSLPDFNKEALLRWINQREWLDHVEAPEYFKGLPSVFATFGVGLALVPSLPKTVFGAVRWINKHPLIIISDRNRDLAVCWLTLFHELGHIIYHENENTCEEDIGRRAKSSKLEKGANSFAYTHLFNDKDLRKIVFGRANADLAMSASGLSKEFNVKPIFTSYWLREAGYLPRSQGRIPIDFKYPD